jgi:Rab family, other
MAKVILLGDGAVGKTSLISRYVFSMFDPHYVETLGTNVTARAEKLETPQGPLEVRLQIWDIIGQERFDSIYVAYYQEADGALLVCDGTRWPTLDSLSGWIRSAEEVLGAFPAVFVVNKSDLPPAFGMDEVREKIRGVSSGAFADSPVYSTSAKTGDHVAEAFQHLARSIAIKKGLLR